ncbi:MAG: DUF3501 family protein [Acidimicrobiales bacterium]|nr:DUF3501 family protein [Acidimicrobiales bacterium]
MSTLLTLDDIADLRAYERERPEFRQHVIAVKKRRRVPVGPFLTLLFENRDTIRFQIQEMARVEKLISDEAIQAELAAYNPLLPDEGHLSATMFIELTSKAELMEWLPKLVGIERSLELRLGEGDGAERVASIPEAAHEAQLTRETITASVHYVRFALDADQARRFRAGPVTLAAVHPEYRHETVLGDETRASLAEDLAGT